MTRFNKLTEAQAERLALLAEECGEVVQAVAKILRHGYDSHNPLVPVPDDENPVTNQMLLEKELGHVECAVRMLCNTRDLRKAEIDIHLVNKHRTIARWLHYQG